jgi:hypothetical protein
MAEVKRLDLGGDILLSGETREDVDAVLQDLIRRRAKIVTPLTQVGKNWVAACTQPPAIQDSDRTSTLNMREVQAARRKRRPAAALCEIEQVGFKLIVTGPTHEAVYACLQELLEDGATLVSDAEESAGTWFAVCDTVARPADDEN